MAIKSRSNKNTVGVHSQSLKDKDFLNRTIPGHCRKCFIIFNITVFCFESEKMLKSHQRHRFTTSNCKDLFKITEHK